MPITADNRDSGSLFVGTPKPAVGAWLLIAGEASPRRISYVAGSDRKGWWTYFKGYGPVPVGRVVWEFVSNQTEPEVRSIASPPPGRLQLPANHPNLTEHEASVIRQGEARTAFDAYLMVDWSGAGKPTKSRKNSIWWSLHTWANRQLVLDRLSNPSSRSAAMQAIRAELLSLCAKNLSVLVCFDFPYGFPAGTAAGINPAGFSKAQWRSSWDQVTALIRDGDDNRNNRFEVAACFNMLLSGQPSPFWGWDASKGMPPAGLSAKKPPLLPAGLDEFRVVDRRIRGPKSAFQLWGAGSVGSQALLGIPRLHVLLQDKLLEGHSLVWPFTTGPTLPDRHEGPRIIHAEIYPSFIEVKVTRSQCKDEAQVQALGRFFAAADGKNAIKRLFEAPRGQPKSVLEEEGWILGVL